MSFTGMIPPGLGAAGGGMGFPIGAGLSFLGGIGGAIQGYQAQKQQKQAFEFARQQLLASQQQQQSTNALARGQQFAGLGNINRGYGQAQQFLSGAGAEGVQAAMDAGRQAQAGAMASSYARGLQNTSAGQNMMAQAQYQMQRNIGGVSQRIAALRAQLAAQHGRAQAGQRNQIGAGYMQQGAQGVNNAQNFFNLTGQYAPQVDPGLWALLGTTGATIDNWRKG